MMTQHNTGFAQRFAARKRDEAQTAIASSLTGRPRRF
jgi:hypothetical protein